MVIWELPGTCIVTSCSGRQPSKHGILVEPSRRSAMITEENLTSKRNVEVINITSIWQARSKYSRQVRFFLVNARYDFTNVGSVNCNFTDFPYCIDPIYSIAWPRRHSQSDILFSKLQQQRPINSHRKTYLHLFLRVINVSWHNIINNIPMLCFSIIFIINIITQTWCFTLTLLQFVKIWIIMLLEENSPSGDVVACCFEIHAFWLTQTWS